MHKCPVTGNECETITLKHTGFDPAPQGGFRMHNGRPQIVPSGTQGEAEYATMPYPPPDDTLVCVCGNEPHDQGFYTCDQAGAEVEPTPEDWSHLWCCNKCGRIIDGWDLHVTGRKE